MIKRNSIYIKLLVPVICLLLIQSVLIGSVLFFNGTIRSLEDNSIGLLSKNTENRSITLENMMVRYWSNLERFETNVLGEITSYADDNGISAQDAIKDYNHANNILNSLAADALSSLRMLSSTGIFVYFTDGNTAPRRFESYGLYFRDLNPLATPADYSDILLLRGGSEIKNTFKIALDGLWEEVFTLTPDDADGWESYVKPVQAAADNPKLSSSDLSYWSHPRLITPTSKADSNRCITYTRPLRIDGKIVAMIGTEVLVRHLETFFPYSDFGSEGQSGYMLASIETQKINEQIFTCDIHEVTGSYIKLILGSSQSIEFKRSKRENVFNLMDKNAEAVEMVYYPIKLYNNHAPFSGEQWILSAMGTESALFAEANTVKTGVVIASASMFAVGVVLMIFIIRSITNPLANIVLQIERNSPYEPVVLKNNRSSTYELSMLCNTLNDMRKKSKSMDAALREERERYLVALESATDSFIEYDIDEDRFLLYHFSAESRDGQPSSQHIDSFMTALSRDGLFHTDDIEKLKTFFTTETDEPAIEVRVKSKLFAHIEKGLTDREWQWLALKVSYIRSDDGSLRKVIGNAKLITEEKLKADALSEANKRDPATGLYNAEFGIPLIEQLVQSANESNTSYSICCLLLENFRQFEAYYGRIFAGLALRNYCHMLLETLGEDATAVRLSNEEIAVLVLNSTSENTADLINSFREKSASVYLGENSDVAFKLHTGIAAGAATGGIEILRSAEKRAQNSAAEESDQSQFKTAQDWTDMGKAAPFEISVSKENIVPLAFELLEGTSDKSSAIRALIETAGKLFELNQVFVCSYDTDFDSNQIIYQWNRAGFTPKSNAVEKFSRQDFKSLTSLLDADGTLLCNSDNEYPEKVRKLLCIDGDENFSALCCTLYENGQHAGKISFKTDTAHIWTESEIYSLKEITKIISAHINIEKSDSASKAKSEFLSRMSHEIRTPMNAIIGMTCIAKERIDDKNRVVDCLSKIDFSAQHLLTLINDVLDMSHIESGKMIIEDKPFSLSVLVKNLEMLMRTPIESKGLVFNIIEEVVHDSVRGDENRLRQVLINLLGNALKFTPPGGNIIFSLKEIEEKDNSARYHFSVKDNGPGIKPEDQKKVFKAFEQTETGLNKKGGTGLGLAISNSIIAAMNGKIELDSVPGKGCDFSFTLDLMQSQEVKNTYAEAQRSDIRYDGKRALLAEDNEINIEIAEFMLKELGFDVTVAVNGKETVDAFLSSEPGYFDIIFMDIQMPVMNGLDATRTIRKNLQHPSGRTVPIIAMTANAFNEDMKMSIEAGMNGHVSKPIDNLKLQSLLKDIFNKQHPDKLY